jgi:hypothetical protein
VRDPRSDGFTGRLAALRAARPALELAATRRLLDLYRRQRKMPAGPLAALVSRRTRARIVAQGELEHALGLSGTIPRLRDAVQWLAARLRPRFGRWF